jgi:hypothetical protein
LCRTSPFVTMWCANPVSWDVFACAVELQWALMRDRLVCRFVQLHHLNSAVLRCAKKESARKKAAYRLYENLDDIPDGIVCS